MKPDRIWLHDLNTAHQNLCTQVKIHPHLSNGQILDVSEKTEWLFALAACLKFVASCSSQSVPLKKAKQTSESCQDPGSAEAVITATVGWSLMRVQWPDRKWLACWRQRVTQDGVGVVSGKGNYSLQGNLGISLDLNTWVWIYFYKNKFRYSQTRQSLVYIPRVWYDSEMWHLRYGFSCDVIDSDSGYLES